MHYRTWLFITGLLGALAPMAGAFGAHRLGTSVTFSAAAKAYETAVTYHFVHVLALLAITAMLAATEGRRHAWASWMLQIAAAAFVGGIVLFSGGIYLQAILGPGSSGGVVPTGGMLLIAAWIALASSAFGLQRTVIPPSERP